ncbi:MAG TPA: hypothetical protein PLV76_08365, partial [Spirochaetales bacterium]|nr:hypothetical protein [Spirochaetales bacterium]
EVAGSMENIKGVMSELAQGSNQIVIALQSLMNKTVHIKDASGNVSEIANKNSNFMTTISNISKEVTNGVSEIVMHVDDINKAMIIVNNISLQNKKNAQDLRLLINKFIV